MNFLPPETRYIQKGLFSNFNKLNTFQLLVPVLSIIIVLYQPKEIDSNPNEDYQKYPNNNARIFPSEPNKVISCDAFRNNNFLFYNQLKEKNIKKSASNSSALTGIARAGEQIMHQSKVVLQNNQDNSPFFQGKQITNSSQFGNGQSEQQIQMFSSPLSQHISDLQLEMVNLKRDMQRQTKERDDKIALLTSENKSLNKKVKEQAEYIFKLQTGAEQAKHLEEQKQKKRQRQREEAEMQRQYAIMMAIEQIESQNMIPNQMQNAEFPNVDTMTYEESIGFVSKGMKEEDISKIPEIKYMRSQMRDVTSCSVCQSDFESNERIKKIKPCNHVYHSDCINQWLKSEKTCPLCKQSVQL